jgi:transcriptional regulator with XRE-family HTH domain
VANGDGGEVGWAEALEQARAMNEAAGRAPATWWAVCRELERLSENGRPTFASWKRTVSRYRKGLLQPTEEKAALLARALGVPRSSLPAASTPLDLRSLERRLESLEDDAADAEDVEASLRVVAEAIRSLARGDSDGALRVLSEVGR